MSALFPRAYAVFACILIAFPPTPASAKTQQSPLMCQLTGISLAMWSCANDNNGVYPTGKSSTEVFQKLLDGGYITDPTVFYYKMPGKVAPTSNKLKPENVSFDVTAGVNGNSSNFVPLVFLTGFKISYAAGSSAIPYSANAMKMDGIAIEYTSIQSSYLEKGADGTVPLAVPKAFSDLGHHYQQLTPDGPLPP